MKVLSVSSARVHSLVWVVWAISCAFAGARDVPAPKKPPPEGVIERDELRIFASSFNKARVAVIVENRNISAGDVASIDAEYGIDRIALHNCTLSKETLRAVGSCKSIVHLSVHDCEANPEWYSELTTSKTLKSFSLKTDGLGNEDEIVKHVSQLPLGVVFVDGGISDKGMRYLSKCKTIKEIAVDSGRVTAAGVLAMSEVLRGCDKISLYCSAVDDGIAEEIGNWKGVTELWLPGTQISNKAVASLSKLSQLQILMTSDTRISKDGTEKLRKALSNATVLGD
jgi:hypothetical protein